MSKKTFPQIIFPVLFFFFFGIFSREVPVFCSSYLDGLSASREAASPEKIFTDWLEQDLAFDPTQGQLPVQENSPAKTVFTPASPGVQEAETERRLVQKVFTDIQKLLNDLESAGNQPNDGSAPPVPAELQDLSKGLPKDLSKDLSKGLPKDLQTDLQTDLQKKLQELQTELQKELTSLEGVPGTDPRWKELYSKMAQIRRQLRLAPLRKHAPRFVFTKHFNLGGSHYAYTEALSDAQAERHFTPGSQLCLMELNADGEYIEKLLLDDPAGIIRDPELTFDGKGVVFSWKKSDRLDDFHLYRLDLESGTIRQLTFGLGFADYEPCCLPSGDIIFNSTRCVQTVDCTISEVSNLYKMSADGQFIRRVTFDQVHDNYPVWSHDGRIIYTRWDYNDRGQTFPQGLFQMNPDGTGQTALYGNNSWFPTTILHARPIPGTQGKILCLFTGHHTRQRGKLGILDPNQGREENEGATLAAPIRETPAARVDVYGQKGEQFCCPVPVTERTFLTAYRSNAEAVENRQEHQDPFSIYFMDLDGNRELLVNDPTLSCNQTALLTPKPAAAERPSSADWEQDSGVFYLQDVFYGPGLAGVDRSKVRSLRVSAIHYRTIGIGRNDSEGEGGAGTPSTPISIGSGSWDTKTVLGEAKIYEDGSACFRVPARTPVYFQVIDQNGHVIQTMRSWSTLQPGETFSCVGCHEDKNSIAARGSSSLAMKAGPQELEPFYGLDRPFSFIKDIQPILDRHCVRCHDNSEVLPPFCGQNKNQINLLNEPKEFSQLLAERSEWSFLTDCAKAEAVGAETLKTQYPIEGGAFGKGPFGWDPVSQKEHTPWNTNGIWLTRELILPKDYLPMPLYANIFFDEDVEIYVNGTLVLQQTGFNGRYRFRKLTGNPLRPGKNLIAVHCGHKTGGRGIDLGLYELKTNGMKRWSEGMKPFSLLGKTWTDPDARRNWSESYLNLTNAPKMRRANGAKSDVVDWLDVQSAPPMLPPYTSGAAKSKLCFMFDGPNPHSEVQLSQKEKDLIACWIDLLVPYCGTYDEAAAWNEGQWNAHHRLLQKRADAEALDLTNRTAWMKNQPAEKLPNSENPYRDLAPEAKREMEAQTVKFTFSKPIRTDQVRLTLSQNSTAAEEFTVQFDSQSQTLSVQPNGRAAVLSFSAAELQEVRISGKTEVLEKIEVLGILR